MKILLEQTHHLAKMGIQCHDGTFLHIEEALFLAEQGFAIVVDLDRNPLSIAQLFTLLAQKGISLFRQV